MRTRQSDRRLIFNPCHGLRARASWRLRPVGRLGPRRLVLRRSTSVFPPPGIMAGRCEFFSRRRRPAGDADVQIADPLVDAFAAAGRDAGYAATTDYNGAE